MSTFQYVTFTERVIVKTIINRNTQQVQMRQNTRNKSMLKCYDNVKNKLSAHLQCTAKN